MTEHWVVNASPLIFLGRIGRLDLLTSLATTIAVPARVMREIEAGIADDPTAITTTRWAAAFEIADLPITDREAGWRLDPGETQVIAHCIGRNRIAVLDDRAGRRVAAVEGVKLIGTLGVLLRAKRIGHIARLTPLIEQLKTIGLRVSDQLVNEILAAAGEV